MDTTTLAAPPIAPAKSVSPTWRRFRDAFRRHPTALIGGAHPRRHGRHRDLRAVARHDRPAGRRADQAPEAAVGGVLVRHRHARPRRLQPRGVRRARVARRRPRRRDVLDDPRLDDRARDRLCARARRRRDARDGRADVDPLGAARHRVDGAHQGERRQRDRRDHARRSPARGAPRPQPRADAARAALCRSGDRGGNDPAAAS